MSETNDSIHLSLIIPAYNEALRLPPTLTRVLEYLSAQPFTTELIIVDDGSSDGTGEVAAAAIRDFPLHRIVRNEPNRGKALSVKRGLLEGRGKYLLFSDADLSTPIEEAGKLLAELEAGADVAIASRQLPDSVLTVHQPWYREFAGKMFGWINQIILLPGIPDSQCGFKAFRREAAHEILSHQKLSGWAFDAELMFIARKLGLKIAQVPVTWTNDPNSKVKMLRDGFKMVMDLFRIRRLHRRLK
ncbi:MAG: dolichyl-phosphate beta-glucosyltransferase [Armatimonadia bacterium]